ncbi:MAG: CoA ester lyase, partial [Pseudomonadota bacterium]
MTYHPRRSALYMPGSNERALEKAKSLDADVIIFDLEDSVAPDAKLIARTQVAAALESGAYGRRELVARVNGLDSEWGADDVREIAAKAPSALLIPKVETAEQLHAVAELVPSDQPNVALWAMIETPLAIVNLKEIAEASRDLRLKLGCFIVGPNDLVKDTRVTLDANRTAALYWLSAIVTAARAYGIEVLDGVYNNFKDLDGYTAECRHGQMLGMDGKTLIHPSQISIANEIFSPAVNEVEWARQIIAAFDQPENQGKGVINVDGQMVELLHVEMARRTVAIADA